MSKRLLLFVPEINPNSFVFFFYQGGLDSRSWSVREYAGGAPMTRYARDFPGAWTAGTVLDMAARDGAHAIPAPPVPTDDISFWTSTIDGLNQEYLGTAPPDRTAVDTKSAPTPQQPLFPILDLDELRAHSKGRKRQDMNRILTSPNSEDYVTWNVFRLLARRDAEEWWRGMLAAAEGDSGSVEGLHRSPTVSLWRREQTPPAYEAASRDRMRRSPDPRSRSRATKADPVEGVTEVDVAFESPSALVFVEAKLGADTTYDPSRHQLIRNMDCCLEAAGDRTAAVWLLAPSAASDHIYRRLVDHYRKSPDVAHQLVPHRDADTIAEMCSRLAVVTWAAALDGVTPDDDEERAVLEELRRRLPK